jgi:hypothetical protein
MARNDIKVVKDPGPTVTYQSEDRTASSQTVAYLPGEPLKVGGTGTNFVLALATGDPLVATDEFVGICRKASTETSTADGEVEVTSIGATTVLRGQATTTTNMDTAAELVALIGDWIAMDVTGAGTNGPTGVFTFDENEGTDPNVHGIKIITGNVVKGSLDCVVHPNASYAPLTGQTMD